jgi:uncharacterized protein YbdZ (MbtH family)
MRRLGLMDFEDYRCRHDCADFRRGQQWAKQQDIHHGSRCMGNSHAFYQGCLEVVATHWTELTPDYPEE